VRELENLLERAMVLRPAGTSAAIERRDLHLPALAAPTSGLVLPLENGLAELGRLTARAERDLIARALAAWPGLSHAELAARLGTNRRVLELRLKSYGLDSRGAER